MMFPITLLSIMIKQVGLLELVIVATIYLSPLDKKLNFLPVAIKF